MLVAVLVVLVEGVQGLSLWWLMTVASVYDTTLAFFCFSPLGGVATLKYLVWYWCFRCFHLHHFRNLLGDAKCIIACFQFYLSGGYNNGIGVSKSGAVSQMGGAPWATDHRNRGIICSTGWPAGSITPIGIPGICMACTGNRPDSEWENIVAFKFSASNSEYAFYYTHLAFPANRLVHATYCHPATVHAVPVSWPDAALVALIVVAQATASTVHRRMIATDKRHRRSKLLANFQFNWGICVGATATASHTFHLHKK